MKILILTEAPATGSNLSHGEFLKLARAHFQQPGPFMEDLLRHYEAMIDEMATKDSEMSDREADVQAREAVLDGLQETHHQFNCPTCGAPLELDLEIPNGD